jgi:dienelactone hydrolase
MVQNALHRVQSSGATEGTAGKARAPGNRSIGIPRDQVERFAAALDSIGIDNDIHVYDAVNHGFWLRVDEDRELREEPARDAWNRLKRFLSRVLD